MTRISPVKLDMMEKVKGLRTHSYCIPVEKTADFYSAMQAATGVDRVLVDEFSDLLGRLRRKSDLTQAWGRRKRIASRQEATTCQK